MEPARDGGERGHPDFTECIPAPSLSPRSGAGRYDDIFPVLAHWASLCRPCRGSVGISEGLSRWSRISWKTSDAPTLMSPTPSPLMAGRFIVRSCVEVYTEVFQ